MRKHLAIAVIASVLLCRFLCASFDALKRESSAAARAMEAQIESIDSQF